MSIYKRKSQSLDTAHHSVAEQDEFCVNNEWKLMKKLGAGSFGEIYMAINKKTKESAAVKMETVKQNHNQLKGEHHLLKTLEGKEGITKVHWYGKDGEQNLYNVLVMELLGPSLEDLHVYCNGKFSLKTTLMLADQMFRRVRTLHENFLIHRDIKPDNFVMGTGKNCNTVYIIDFGLSKYYMDPITKQHHAFRDFRNLTGTARYCSINAHSGYEQSRRDDLESLVYVFIYFLKGSLPWQGLPAESKREKFRKIYKTKMAVRPEALCSGLPEELAKMLNYCRSLAFEEDPRYKFLINMIWKVMQKRKYTYDCIYDWTPRDH